MTYLLEHHPIEIWAFFFGLIVASALLVARDVTRWNAASVVSLLCGIAVAWWITVASPSQTPETWWFILLSGAIAICAMILPGISGAFILLLMGKYQFILNAVSSFDIGILALFATGAVAEQLFAMQMDEFMKRRYEFRYNALTTEVEYRERHSFNFYFRPVDKRVLASITMNAMCEGVKMWDRDVIRYLDSDHVPVYHPVEDFLYHLPRWDGKDRILELANRVPCDNPHWAPLFRRWFLSMTAHWMGMDKRHANSTSPLLIGPQAYRKSTFCRMLLPPALQAYYTDSIDFSRKRDAELYLNRFLLINMDEFDQISPTQQAFLKHILQKPVVNTRRPNASAVEELRRYASFIATSNHRDLLTDTSGSRRFIGIYMTGGIDVSRPIDYEQLYAQALELLYHNERYWFDSEEEAIMTESNREFEQSPAIEQLFMVYYRGAEEEEEGEWLLAIDILRRIQKASKMTFSARQASYFGRILQRLGVKSRRKTYGTYYHVVPLEVK